VVSGVAMLVALPSVVRALPVADRPVSAADLLARIIGSRSVPYSGYAEATGALGLPVTSGRFGSVADLLGGRSELRVWWRTPTDWRVDSLAPTGETGVHHTALGSWEWDYESAVATLTEELAPTTIRLPVSEDLLPPELGRRMLGDVTAREVLRLPARRVAGRDAPGLSLRPQDPAATIGRVDVWADAATGIPLSVDVYGRGQRHPVVSSAFLDFSPAAPAATRTAFTPPKAVQVYTDEGPDFGEFLADLDGRSAPAKLAGMPRTDTRVGLGSLAVYGRGVAQMALTPLPLRTGWSLRRQLSQASGVTESRTALTLSVGPVGLLLTPPEGDVVWLLTGTVTSGTLTRAAGELVALNAGGPG
jgi:hypothetical protein